MPTSNNLPSNDDYQQSLFSRLCQASDLSPFIKEEEVIAVKHSCSGRFRRNIIACGDEYIDEYLNEVDGLDLNTIDLLTLQAGPISDFVPIIPRGLFKRPAHEVPYGTVGVMLNDVMNKPIRAKNGYYTFPDNATVNSDVLNEPVFKGKRVILFSVGQDVLIETVWWDRHGLDFFQKISEMGFYAVTGMNFSLISGECPLGHALNIKKSLCYCRGMDRLGVWTIPHVYAVNNSQRARWVDWLDAHPDVRVVTLNTQLQRKQRRGMSDAFDTIQALLERTDVHVIIHGRGKGLPKELRDKYAPRLHYAASGPLKNAIIKKDRSVREYVDLFRLGLSLPVSTTTELYG